MYCPHESGDQMYCPKFYGLVTAQGYLETRKHAQMWKAALVMAEKCLRRFPPNPYDIWGTPGYEVATHP